MTWPMVTAFKSSLGPAHFVQDVGGGDDADQPVAVHGEEAIGLLVLHEADGKADGVAVID